MVHWRWILGAAVFCILPGWVALVAPAPVVAAQSSSSGVVAQLALDGPIGPAAAEYFDGASARAVGDGAVAIVLRLDTPGGLSESMRQIITSMLACKVPVLVYVAPGGARAASAGTYILYAGQIAAMAPATHVGAATPVRLGGGTPLPLPKIGEQPATPGAAPRPASAAEDDDAESRKILNDSIAYIRSLAQLRGRNVEWAEQAVNGAATLTAVEAAQQKVIDFVAADITDLLTQADGRKVQVGDRTVSLRLKGAAVRDYAPNARSRFLFIITNPIIAYLLLLAGIAGLFLEVTHPGVLLPGIAGVICLLVGLYALQLLPVNYAGLGLMALGIGLLAAEAVSPTVGALGIGGVISFAVGSVMLMNTGVPGYEINIGVIAGIAVSAAVLIALIVRLMMHARRSREFSGDAAMLRQVAQLLEPVAAGDEAWANVQGERWRVRCDSALPAGAHARILRRQGMLLWVEPI